MRSIIFSAALCLACTMVRGEEPTKPTPPVQAATNSDKDKASFLFGSNLGTSFARFGVELDMAALEASARDALAGKPSKYTDIEQKQILKDFFAYIAKKPVKTLVPGDLKAEERAKASYLFGRTLANSIDSMAEDLNLDLFFSTYITTATGGKFNVDTQKLTEAAKSYLESIKPKSLERMCAKNKKLGSAFLEENKKKEGVKVTPSGLQYKILKEGKGPVPVLPGRILAHFKGTFVDGNVFHDTRERGTPAKFSLDGVIDGWMEALKMMPEGSVWELYVPSDLAYGDRGSPGIPPGSTIIYELEVVTANVPVEKPTDKKTAPEGEKPGTK